MKLLTAKKALLGMVHVRALPGTPRDEKMFEKVVEQALAEAKAFEKAGFQGVILENMHDVPYLRTQVGPEIVAAMAVVAHEVKKNTHLSLGIQILAGANAAALSVAQAVEADFVRVEGFVFAHVADEGLIEACAGPLLRLRRELGAESIKIFADIKKKHSSHALTADVSIAETAHAAEFFGADGVILTGSHTGATASLSELEQVKSAVHIPVWIGSGITAENFCLSRGLGDVYKRQVIS
ncbi:MAG: BtpA family membrane complex biogenesis protein [Proteobacteria bacterium]|nr:BtpA family membrane complex biogenesis protein [Pseudomonadota bacterium]